MMNLTTIAKIFGHDLKISGNVHGVCIDSRKIQPGDLFIAIKGNHFDGHDFIAQAASAKAAAVLCEHKYQGPLDIPQIIVPDTIKALASLAEHHRQTISCPIIAITGSNGKTSVKEMIAGILPKPSHANQGNFNNHIGAPFSILGLRAEHKYAVFELGANHSGEIAYTANIVKPGISLINNIAPAHIEGFGSIQGVASSKGEIYQALPKAGIAIVNEDDEYAHFWDEILIDKEVLRFSLNKKTPINTKNLSYKKEGNAEFTLSFPSGAVNVSLQVPGEHTVRNALAAATCCYAAGISLDQIAAGLEQFSGVPGRMTYLSGKNHSVIIDDTYNANLRSVLTAIECLSKRNGKRILVLGDLGELGSWTQQHHEEIGTAAAERGIDLLLTCGKHSAFSSQAFGSKGRHYTSQADLVKDLLFEMDEDTTILVKGSRSAAMEKVVELLKF
jgi:UDP-N-acetylmuramoyl-tripeptide--D-alanyl-D-alanine ligase